MKTKIEIGNWSDVGKVRQVNEDYFGSFSGSYGELIIVCDGMGGHKGGAAASRIAVEQVKSHFAGLGREYNPRVELYNALRKADEALHAESARNEELKEMGSTAVALLLHKNQITTAHIGDSRIYLIRDEKIHQITKDHSLVQQMVDGGLITEEAAKTHPKRNVIVKALGADAKFEPEIAEPITVFKNDTFVLCTDGLTGYVSNEELLAEVQSNSVQEVCRRLVEMANDRGGKDNITVQIVKVAKGRSLPLKPKVKRNISIGIAAIFFACAVFVLYPYVSDWYRETFPPQQKEAPIKQVPKPSVPPITHPRDSTPVTSLQDSALLLKGKVIISTNPNSQRTATKSEGTSTRSGTNGKTDAKKISTAKKADIKGNAVNPVKAKVKVNKQGKDSLSTGGKK